VKSGGTLVSSISKKRKGRTRGGNKKIWVREKIIAENCISINQKVVLWEGRVGWATGLQNVVMGGWVVGAGGTACPTHNRTPFCREEVGRGYPRGTTRRESQGRKGKKKKSERKAIKSVRKNRWSLFQYWRGEGKSMTESRGYIGGKAHD